MKRSSGQNFSNKNYRERSDLNSGEVWDQEFLNASGQVPYRMINDYLFRAVLQSNNKALRGLICALLHLAEEEVFSVEITNPVVLGEAVADKEFRLDINVILNNHTLINLEMQIANKLNWRKRSVMYLCRSFDQLNHGQSYMEAKPVVHIGFLDYSLFEECPEFHSTYKLVNIKNYQKYSDSLTLHVVDLSHIELATEEDKRYHIHEWAAFFKADTWEEIRMIASKDEYLKEASQTMFRMSAEDLIRKRCRDREEYYQDLRSYERAIEESERKREQDRLEHEEDVRSYEKAIEESERKREQDRLEHEEDVRSYERAIEESERKREQDRLEHEKAIEESERKREQDRLEHEEDLRSYERAIEESERKREQDRLEHEKVIEEKTRAYEQAAAEIKRLREEVERLKKG